MFLFTLKGKLNLPYIYFKIVTCWYTELIKLGVLFMTVKYESKIGGFSHITWSKLFFKRLFF